MATSGPCQTIEPPAPGLRARAAAVVLVGLGPFMLLVMPEFVSTLGRTHAFTARELGYVASAELSGLTLASIVAAALVGRRPVGALAAGGIGLMIAANVGCLFTLTPALFILLRIAAGAGGGTLVALGTRLIAATAKPDRLYGLAIALQVGASAIGLYALPLATRAGGLAGCLIFLVCVAAALLPVLPCLPRTLASAASGPTRGAAPSRAAIQVLLSTLIFSAGIGGAWTYVAEMGTAAGLKAEFVGEALAGAMAVSLSGAILASWLDVRLGRAVPLLFGTAGICVGAVLLSGRFGPAAFAGGVLAFNLFWSFVGPYQLGTLAQRDTSGFFVTLLPGFQGMGFATGPAIASEVLVRWGYAGVRGMALACLASSCLLILPQSLRRGSRHAP
ncbi:MAG TPA: hypothetical protein VHB68_19235 [Steroidobacteraceae bacterium]|nr:hypothetical protein [Steroidobacteraceae bacterium]